MNISNGGLIAQLNGNMFYSDLSQYSGTRALNEDDAPIWNMKAVMWFAAPDGRGIYCSNQRDYDYLTYLDANNMTETRVQKRACHNLAMHDGRLLFIDEEDSQIHEYDPDKDRCSLVVKEKANSFILVTDMLYFAAENSLKSYNLRARRIDKLSNCAPICLNYTEGQLIFADKSHDYAVSAFDLRHEKLTILDRMPTQSMITSNEHVFVSDLSDNNSIVRINIRSGESIRFCGESADKLHIINDQLYFLNQNDSNTWHHLPLSGGRPNPVR